MRRYLALLLLSAGLLAPATASAADLYAAPAGTGDCSKAAPCTLSSAFMTSGAADTVYVTPGTYPSINGATENARVVGVLDGRTRPVITTSDRLVLAKGASLLDVRGTVDGTVGMVDLGASSSALDVRNQGSGFGCRVTMGVLLSSSLCVGGQAAGAAMSGGELVNVTAVGRDGVFCFSGTCNIRNVLASGTRYDVSADAPGNPAPVVNTTTSAFSTKAGTVTGTPVASPPAFVDQAGGNYRLAGTTTVDQGSGSGADGVAGIDLDSNARIIGGKPDVGAYERVTSVPTVTAEPATEVTDTTAILRATVTTNGGWTTWKWSGVTGTGAVVGTEASRVATLPLTGLQPGTTYSYDLVATNDAGSSAPVTVTVTTTGTVPGSGGGGTTGGGTIQPTVPATTTPGTSPPTSSRITKLRITRPSKAALRRLLRTGRAASVRVTCPKACSARVTGEVRRGKRRLGRVTAPRRTLRIAAQGTGRISFTASKALRQKARKRTVTVLLRVTVGTTRRTLKITLGT